MALAKYYEDILDRLLEENENLRGQLTSDQNYSEDHYKILSNKSVSHLDTSTKALNEFLNILTDPQYESLFSSIDYKELYKKYEEKIDEIELCKTQLNKLLSDKHNLQLIINEMGEDLNDKKIQLGLYVSGDELLNLKATIVELQSENKEIVSENKKIRQELEDTRKLVMKSRFPDTKPIKIK